MVQQRDMRLAAMAQCGLLQGWAAGCIEENFKQRFVRGAELRDGVIDTAAFEFEIREIVMRDHEGRDAIASTSLGRLFNKPMRDCERMFIPLKRRKRLRCA